MIPTLKKLNQTALSLLEVLELEPLYEVIVREGLRIVNARYGTIYLADKETLKREYSTVPITLQVQIRKNGFTYNAFNKKKILFIKVASIEKVHREIKDFEVKSVVLIPLCYREKCIGVISLDTYKDIITEAELTTLDLFGSMATLAIQQANLHKQTQLAVEQRDLLISLTAHEFRTPLTTINGYVQLLQRKLNKDQSLLLSYTNELYSETNRLIDLTNELLEMSRIKTGKTVFSFADCTMNEILEKAIARFQFTFPEHKIIFRNETNENIHLIADFNKMLQVFTNFFDNAGKFSLPTEPIIVTLQKRKKWAVVSIKDKGRGISHDDIKKIFIGFYKAKNSDESQGMGLGLFIAQSIVEAHQGKITVNSELGKGTDFEIILPYKPYGI